MILKINRDYDMSYMYNTHVNNILTTIDLVYSHSIEKYRKEIKTKALMFCLLFLDPNRSFDREYIDLVEFLTQIKFFPVVDDNLISTKKIFPLVLILKNLCNNAKCSGNVDALVNVLWDKLGKEFYNGQVNKHG